MQKGQRTEDRHAESWDQVCWALGWRRTAASWLFFSIDSSFTLLLFSFLENLTSKVFLLFFSLKSLSLNSLCPMFSLISLKVSVLRLALSHVSSSL
jgi:hypothetical protein